MKVKTTIPFDGQPDQHGDIILPGAYKGLPKKMPVTNNEGKVIGQCDVFSAAEGIEITADIPGPMGIGFSIADSEMIDGTLHIKELQLHSVSILPAKKKE